jgi:Uma2 family endonuclease
MSTVTTPLLTAEEYGMLPDDGTATELVRGRVVTMNMPYPRHGEICIQVGYLLRRFLEDHPLGRVTSNDSGVITERGPDTVRGADVAFWSYALIPRGPMPQRYLDVVPELVFEVRSPTDRRGQVLAKVAEYLEAGVKLVCVLDEQTMRATLYHADRDQRVLGPDEELDLSEVLPGFRVVVRRFFE